MTWKFQQSPNCHRGRNSRATRIGIHSTETPGDSAQGVLDFFGKVSTQASAHFVSGASLVGQSVRVQDTAWAMPNVNADGIHIEICGYSRWSQHEWTDGEGKLPMFHAACVAAELVSMSRFFHAPIDVRWLADYEVAGRMGTGFIEHRTATRVLGPKGGHTDPGDGFPVDAFLDGVNWWLPHITTWDFVA